MPNNNFNIPYHITGITHNLLYTELVAKLTATASVAQSVRSAGLAIQGRGFNSQPEGLEVAFFATAGLGW